MVVGFCIFLRPSTKTRTCIKRCINTSLIHGKTKGKDMLYVFLINYRVVLL